MKKLLSALLCALLAVSLVSGAFAATAVFDSTRTALTYLDSIDLSYDYYGLDEDGDELIIVPNSDSELGIEYEMYCFFDRNGENCYIYLWDLITFEDADYVRVLQVCNDLNDTYRFVTFTVDPSDNTVYVTVDLIYRDNEVDQIFWEGLCHVVNIVHEGYPLLAPYNK